MQQAGEQFANVLALRTSAPEGQPGRPPTGPLDRDERRPLRCSGLRGEDEDRDVL